VTKVVTPGLQHYFSAGRFDGCSRTSHQKGQYGAALEAAGEPTEIDTV
jgi:hypothetical protein